jgi:hypothetical protein
MKERTNFAGRLHAGPHSFKAFYCFIYVYKLEQMFYSTLVK